MGRHASARSSRLPLPLVVPTRRAGHHEAGGRPDRARAGGGAAGLWQAAAAWLLVPWLVGVLPLMAWAQAEPASAPSEAMAPRHVCSEGETLATGRAEAAIFAREASRGVTAFWCETYDEQGRAHRAGSYWDHHPDGSLRTRARYVDGRIEGEIEVFDEDGTLWLRGELVGGEWSGPFALFYANGHRWLSTRFSDGQLDAPVETWFSDGSPQWTTDPHAAQVDPLPMARLERRTGERGEGAPSATPTVP